jgi:hypothetical protein
MMNVIYCRTTVPASKALDGETPTQIMVTEEANLCAVWRLSFDGAELLGTYHSGNCREFALEDAVCRALGRCHLCGADEQGCYCFSDAEPKEGKA